MLEAARRARARLVARGGVGLAWLTLPDGEAGEVAAVIAELRARFAPGTCVVQDAPTDLLRALDPWGPVSFGSVALMCRVKERFDPSGALNKGLFVGGI